jgi:hypothetical protein
MAVVSSFAGTALLWIGGGNSALLHARLDVGGAAPFAALAGLGCLLFAVAALSVRWSRVGVIVAGSGHVVFALPYFLSSANLHAGAFAPTRRFLTMLSLENQAFASGGFSFVMYGSSLMIGFALIGVGVLARRARPKMLERVLAAVGGVLALPVAVWVVAAGAAHHGRALMYDNDVMAGLVVVAAAVLFGLCIAPSGRSAIGSWIAGGVVSLVGLVLLVVDPQAYMGLTPTITATLPFLGWSGGLLAVGASVLGLALGVTLRAASVMPPTVASAQETQPYAV